MRKLTTICTMLFTIVSGLVSQENQTWQAGVYVDADGVLRWNGSNQEVSLFGVNYTTPFAYSYRAHKRLGLSIKKAIDLDVAHMKRLDLDAFRVHVWDREISDEQGNLLRNEHLDLFDYLLAKLAERGIKSIITPIAWWGNGWPEPDMPTSGFSQRYSKLELITNAKAREAQRDYLRQFIEHVNPYTKLAYKNEPSIIAIEIINEPHHPDNEQATTDYINEMASVLRAAGYKKPIFYNISQNWSDVQANAVAKSNVDGVSFQWYPTGLVHNAVLKGNYLPNVDKYAIPSEGVVGFDKKARMVYEFDAADVGGSYMYPAMARSFREAGMQFATMFSYDPVQIAWSNTEYPTHFLNLLYAPSKALSLMVAAKAFGRLPRGESYGTYPENNRFGDVRVSYEEDLSELNTDSAFIYSNSTKTVPQNAGSLQHIAGCGNSPLVYYVGTGAYFLDKLEDGIWRLEVYPDVLWLRDPFEVTSLSRQVARLFWREREMKIALPDLGEAYSFHSFSTKEHGGEKVHDGRFVRPGIYIVTAKHVAEEKIQKYVSKKEMFLDGLYRPPPSFPGIYVVNKTSPYMVESQPANFKFRIASEQNISNAYLYIKRLGWRGFSKHALKHIGGFEYAVVDTPRMMQSGKLEYCVGVELGDKVFTFPEGIQGAPGNWDFSTNNLWEVKVVNPNGPVVLLDALRDRKDFVFPHYSRSMRYSIDYTNGRNSEEVSLALKVSFLDTSATPFGLQLSVAEFVKPHAAFLGDYQHIVITARSTQDSACIMGVNFLMADGRSYRVDIEVTNNWQDHEIPVSALKSRSALILPDPFPLFLPKIWNRDGTTTNGQLDLRNLECVQIIVGPSSAKRCGGRAELGLELLSVSLTR